MSNRNYRLAFALFAFLISGAISFPSHVGAQSVQKETKKEKKAREKEEKDRAKLEKSEKS